MQKGRLYEPAIGVASEFQVLGILCLSRGSAGLHPPHLNIAETDLETEKTPFFFGVLYRCTRKGSSMAPS